MGLSKIAGALSLVKVVTNGSLLANTKSAIADLTNWPSAEIKNWMLSRTEQIEFEIYILNDNCKETNQSSSTSQLPS